MKGWNVGTGWNAQALENAQCSNRTNLLYVIKYVVFSGWVSACEGRGGVCRRAYGNSVGTVGTLEHSSFPRA